MADTGKYFNNLAKAIHYGVQEGLIGDLSVKEQCNIDDYINYLWEVHNKTDELLGKSILA